MIIDISITNKIASLVDEEAFIVCGNSDYVIKFTFTDEWSEYSDKTARFIFNGKHIDVTFSGNSCEVPIIANAREVLVGVIAGELATTTPARIECKKSVACDDIAGTKTEGIIAINSSHTHENAATLADFNCVASELEGGNEFPILPDYVGVDRPTFRGNYLRYCTDGGVVKRVEEKEENGDKFLRLWFDKGILDTSLSVPDFIDVPIRTVTEKIEEIAGVGLSANSIGLELELPTGGADGEGGIPAVHELPTEAVDGDMCLYAPANIITLADSGKRIYFDWEEVSQLVGDKTTYSSQLISANDETNVVVSVIRNNTTVYFNIEDYVSAIIFEVVFNKGVFKSATYGEVTYNSIEEIPKYYQLPQFDTILDSNLTGNEYLFHTEYRLMKYQGGEWVEAVESGVTQADMETYVTAAINGSLDEIEAMIDESGVLDE